MKTVLYTAITGGYDTLSEVPFQKSGIDLICFTDDPGLRYQTNSWTVRPVPEDLLRLENVRQQRLLKILPHRYLPGYDLSVWIDGNISVKGDLTGFLRSLDFSKGSFLTRRHPSRRCAYEEAKAVLRMGKDRSGRVGPQMEAYRNEGFPENFGLEETNVVARLQKDPRCQLLCNLWAKEVLEKSHRDQLSLDYCRWKSGTRIGLLEFGMRDNPWFSVRRHRG